MKVGATSQVTSIVDQALASGPAGLRKAQRVALKFTRKFQTETEDHFKKRTKFLQTWFDSIDPNARAGARYALYGARNSWRNFR
jgi:hypothetical protein